MSYFDRNGRYLGISSKKNLTSPKKSAKFKGKKFEASKSLNRRKKMREETTPIILSEEEFREYIIADSQEEENRIFEDIYEWWGDEDTGGIVLINDEYNFFTAPYGWRYFSSVLDDSLNETEWLPKSYNEEDNY